jgi:hypothetical protein
MRKIKGGFNMEGKSRMFMFFAVAVLACCYVSMSYGFTLPDTGQTTCYNANGAVIACAGTGEDGANIANRESYIDNGDGTITDTITDLMWQKAEGGSQASSVAGAYCESLSLGGHSDWRLPTVLELQSLVIYVASSSATINKTYFPNAQASGYLTSATTVSNMLPEPLVVNFGNGSILPDGYHPPSGYVRCVRGSQEAASLTDNGNGTVTDSNTGLMWQQGEPGNMTWTDALSYCDALILGGNSGWRVPNVKELLSIVDYASTSSATINTTFFPNVNTGTMYWSSTTDVSSNTGNNAKYAWGVSFGGGLTPDDFKSESDYVRCVLSGQAGPSGGNYTLSVSNSGTGDGTVTSSPSGISCGYLCIASYGSGINVTLTAAANAGSAFTGWSGACSSLAASATCVVTMNSAESVTANYAVAGSTPFSDVPIAESFASYIEGIYNNGITTGCGNGEYCPSEYVSRDQMAAFLVRATQVKAGQSATNFTCNGGANCSAETPYFNDVSTTDGFFPYVQKLKELGITTGCGNGNYCPSEDVTRDQMAAFIIRALYPGGNFTCNGGVPGASGVDCSATQPYFSDVQTTDAFFPYVQKMKELGITGGCGNGNYCPSEDVTRDQMAAFLARAFLGMQ